MFYTPKPSDECSIFKTITAVPKVTTPNDKSSPAGNGENNGSSDKKSLFRMPKLRVRMAVLTNSRPWEDYLTEEYDLHATRIHLPRHYSTWHSRIPREIRHRLTVGNGENATRVNILEWRSRMQGTVPTMTVAAEVLSHGVSMTVASDREVADPWAGMREDGELTEEGVRETLNGNEGGEEENMTEMSTVDGGNNRGVSGPGMRFLNHVSPERRVNLFGFQGRVVNDMLIGSFASVIGLNTGEEVFCFWQYSRSMPMTQGTTMPSTPRYSSQIKA